MVRLFLEKWIKRIMHGILKLKSFNWKDLWGTTFRESVISVATVLVTVGTMKLLGA